MQRTHVAPVDFFSWSHPDTSHLPWDQVQFSPRKNLWFSSVHGGTYTLRIAHIICTLPRLPDVSPLLLLKAFQGWSNLWQPFLNLSNCVWDSRVQGRSLLTKAGFKPVSSWPKIYWLTGTSCLKNKTTTKSFIQQVALAEIKIKLQIKTVFWNAPLVLYPTSKLSLISDR